MGRKGNRNIERRGTVPHRGECALAQMEHIDVVRWAMVEPVSTATERTVLMVIAVMLGGGVAGRLTQASIADAAALSPRAVRAAMARLSSGGAVEIQQHGRGAPLVTLAVQGGASCRAADGAGRQMVPCGGVQGGTSCRAGQGKEGAPTVSKKIPPPTEGGVGGTTTTTTTDYVQAPDHFAQRRDTTTTADIDFARWQALAKAIAGRATSGRGRFSVEDLTAVETATVRSLIAEHGIDAVEEVAGEMPARADHPTAMLSYRLGRRAEAQREAERERKRVRRDGLYVAKGPLKPEEISDIDVMAALGITDEDLAS